MNKGSKPITSKPNLDEKRAKQEDVKIMRWNGSTKVTRKQWPSPPKSKKSKQDLLARTKTESTSRVTEAISVVSPSLYINEQPEEWPQWTVDVHEELKPENKKVKT